MSAHIPNMCRFVTLAVLGSTLACAHRGVTIPDATDARWKPIASTEVPVHRHSAALRARLRSGSQTIVLEPTGAPPRTITLRPGDVFEIPAGVLHRESFVGASVVELSGVGPVKTERP